MIQSTATYEGQANDAMTSLWAIATEGGGAALSADGTTAVDLSDKVVVTSTGNTQTSLAIRPNQLLRGAAVSFHTNNLDRSFSTTRKMFEASASHSVNGAPP